MPGRILVVDDVPANVRLLEAKLSAEFYEVLTATDGPSALAVALAEKPDIILLDVMMPGMDGFEVTRHLKNNPETKVIPVVLITALSDIKDRIEGLRSGADDFLTKPVQDAALLARVRSLLRLKMMIEEWRARDQTAQAFGLAASVQEQDHGQGGNLLLLEQNPVDAGNIVDALGADAHRIEIVREIDAVAARVLADHFDLLMISTNFPKDESLRLCSRLRGLERTRHTPILLLADFDEQNRLAQALDLGVNDFIVTPADAEELLARVRIQVRRSRYQSLLRQNFEQSLTLALTDSLTGVYNRRYFETHARQLADKALRHDKPLSVVAIDIDFFKRVNDSHGHAAGDAVLREVARRLAGNLRNLDLVARLGGEEFVILMPDTNLEIAMMVAERLRGFIANAPVAIDATTAIPVTISLGVAGLLPGQNRPFTEVLADADQALYAAKNGGRNRVMDARALPGAA